MSLLSFDWLTELALPQLMHELQHLHANLFVSGPAPEVQRPMMTTQQ